MLRISDASLRQMLTLPYVILVIVTAAVIGLLSYSAGRNAVDTLSNYVLNETVSRISQAVDKHVAGSEAVLETAFPADVPPPVSVADEIDVLRTRFWLATSIHRDPNNYAYYGDRHGQFFGIYRFSETEAELRLRSDGDSPRSIYQYSRINGELGQAVQEQRIFEPRDRPWYKAGQGTRNQTWTAIYIDFKTLQLVSTRARRVNNAAGEFEGVVATDLSLQLLNEFLKGLPLTPNGFAFIVEPDGNMIATSRGPHIRKGVGDDNTRLNVMQSTDPLIAATYRSVRDLTVNPDNTSGPLTSSFEGPDGEIVQTGYYRLQDAAGLDWIIAVAVPRSDFMFEVTRNVRRTALLGLLASVLIAVIGFIVLNLITRDLRRLARVTKSVGDGVMDLSMPSYRKDEIGELARAIATMQKRLLTDRLTGIPNREAVVRRIEDRIIEHRRRGDSHPFAVLFVDLNGFKAINDRWGHEVGDRVLIEFARRLSDNLEQGGLAARYGGDEFLVLLDEVSSRADASQSRDRLEVALKLPLQSPGQEDADTWELKQGGTIGLAICPDDGYDVETLIKMADLDMYQRKIGRPSGLEPA